VDINLSRDEFLCPACNNLCNCASCLRSRNLPPNHFMLSSCEGLNSYHIRTPPSVLTTKGYLVGSIYDRKPNSRGRGKMPFKSVTTTRKRTSTTVSRGRKKRKPIKKTVESDLSDSENFSDGKKSAKKTKKKKKLKALLLRKRKAIFPIPTKKIRKIVGENRPKWTMRATGPLQKGKDLEKFPKKILRKKLQKQGGKKSFGN